MDDESSPSSIPVQDTISETVTVEVNPCPIAVNLLHELQVSAERIPASRAEAAPNHRLNAFNMDPSSCISPDTDDWEDILNPMLKGAFGWGEDTMREAVKGMLHCGQYGLDGFIRYVQFFMMSHGLKGGMVESKIKALLEEVELRCVK
jgi:hypothetical protein